MILHTFIALLFALVLGLMGSDCYAWLPRVQTWLLKCASARLPAEMQKTYYEECLAEIEQLPNAEVSRTVRAFGFLVAAWRIGFERIGVSTLVDRAGIRSLDIVLSLGSIVLFIPLLLVIAFAIKRNDPGPAIFGAPTIGKGGRSFGMYKFRTTYVDPNRRLARRKEDHPGLLEEFLRTFKPRRDPRVTTPGIWLRRTDLDRLPLLLNVLRGEITIVGPMPCTVHLFQNLSQTTREAYMAFKPGIISPAALRELSGEDAYIADFRYMKNRNLMTDIKVMLVAAAVVLTGVKWEDVMRKLPL